MIGIYKITNPKGKVYIGQAVDVERRWREYEKHLGKGQSRLHYSLKKYGISNHAFEIIENCSEEDLNIRERYWQEYYNVLVEGLNCRLTGTEDKSGKLSDEHKKRISESSKGHKLSEVTKKRMSESRTGKTKAPMSREAIDRAAKTRTGQKRSEETKRKMSEAKKGKPASQAWLNSRRKNK